MTKNLNKHLFFLIGQLTLSASNTEFRKAINNHNIGDELMGDLLFVSCHSEHRTCDRVFGMTFCLIQLSLRTPCLFFLMLGDRNEHLLPEFVMKRWDEVSISRFALENSNSILFLFNFFLKKMSIVIVKIDKNIHRILILQNSFF